MQRLKTRAQFQAVLADSMVAKTAHFAMHRTSFEVSVGSAQANKPVGTETSGVPPSLFRQQDMWIGAMVPKRWAKRAVTRNAIKRQIYAVASELRMSFPDRAFVIRLRCAFAKSEFLSAMSEQLKQAVRMEVQALMEIGSRAP